MKIFALLLTLFTSTAAFADQCQVLTDSQVVGAKALLEHSIEHAGGFVSLCQNCGEHQAQFVGATGKISKIKFDPTIVAKSWTLQMANSPQILDAAYLYVYTNELSARGNFMWFNVAELVGCAYTGSSKWLSERNAEGTHTRVFSNGTITH